jgi:hypothetical protein
MNRPPSRNHNKTDPMPKRGSMKSKPELLLFLMMRTCSTKRAAVAESSKDSQGMVLESDMLHSLIGLFFDGKADNKGINALY